tara:strand:- start:453 stop:944 length:492 start_codon:yes stop_codon:yes gene_type:complete
MTLQRGLTEVNGNFKTQARLVVANVKENSLVFIDGTPYSVNSVDLGSGILLSSGLYANPVGSAIGETSGKNPVSGIATLTKNSDSFITANSTLKLPDVTSFTGGESVKVVAAIAAVTNTLTVDGTQSELIKTSSGGSDTVFNLTSTGVSFEFIFNAVTGNWEV